MGLFAFVLCMCCMALWSVRKRSFRSKSLRRMTLCMCIGLVAPCLYGMALSLLHLCWVSKLAVLVAYNMTTGIVLKDQRCNSFEAEKAYRPVATGSAVASKLKPWNISGVKGRQKKKLVRLMFCGMCGRGNCKNSMKESVRHSCDVLCEVVARISSAFCAWQNVWKHHRSVRVVAFSLFWLFSGGDREYGCLSTTCILCTLCNLHCTWCRMLSFVTCCLVCPSHNVTVAACFAMFVPFAPRVVFPTLEIRASGSRQTAAKCVRWRCRNRDMLTAHADLFEGHGMESKADCHTLETKAMSAEECQRHKEEIEACIRRQENFVDKYKILWDGMKTLMTWDRMEIKIEATSDAGLGRATVFTRSSYVRKKLQQHLRTDVSKDGSKTFKYRSVAAVMGPLQACVNKYNEEVLKRYGPEEISGCLCRLFEEIDCNRLMWQAKEASRNTLSLEASCRAVALRHAQEKQEPTSALLRDFSILHAMYAKEQKNTFTGLVNFQDSTCWLNSAIQLLWHSGFVSEWLHYSESVPRTSLQRPFPVKEFRQLFNWMGNYEVIAPIEMLHFVLCHWQNYGFIDRQCDAMEFLQVVHELSNAPESTLQVGVCFDACPRDISQNVLEASCTMQEYVNMQLQESHVTLENESNQILVRTMPFVVNAVTGHLFWMQNRIVDWDSEVDLSKLFRQSPQISQRSGYKVKAAILHVHAEDSPVSATSGHYVTAIRQNNEWHLANDEFVRVVRINECPLLPCGILFEKCDDHCSQKTMLIEGRMCEALSWDQCICKDAKCVPGGASAETMDSADITMLDETAESGSRIELLVGGEVFTRPTDTVSRTQLPVGGAVLTEPVESVDRTELLGGGAVLTEPADTAVRRNVKEKEKKGF